MGGYRRLTVGGSGGVWLPCAAVVDGDGVEEAVVVRRSCRGQRPSLLTINVASTTSPKIL